MLRSDGILYHVDYGTIFSTEHIGPIHIYKDLIEDVGGSYTTFKKYCTLYYCKLRKWYNVIYSAMISLIDMDTNKYTKEFIRNNIISKLLIGHTDESASNFFGDILDKCRRHTINQSLTNSIYNLASMFVY